MAATQRFRLLAAMTDVVAEKGYPAATVADVLTRARVSRQTFYENFQDKQDCFLAVLGETAGQLERMLPLGGSGAEPVLGRLQHILSSYLTLLSENPKIARVFLVESYAAGPAAQRVRVEVQERFTELVYQVLETAPGRGGGPEVRFACRILVGGIAALVTSAIVTGDLRQLAEAEPAMLRLIQDLVGPS